MSLAGFKKQINKANQFMSEKIGSAKGSKLEDDFIELERKTDATANTVDHILTRTKEYLQPNPAARAKVSMQSTVQKVRGEARMNKYPHPEGLLGETMEKGGEEIGEESVFAQSLKDAGEAFNQLGDIREAMDNNVKQTFLDPLTRLQNSDIKEIMQHRKKLQGRRLDFDCKKRKGHKVSEEEIRVAEEKFEESKELCYSGMMNLMDSEVEQISQLAALAEALEDYHKHCHDVMRSLVATLNERVSEASSRPRTERQRPTIRYGDDDDDEDNNSSGSSNPFSPQLQPAVPSAPPSNHTDGPMLCTAIYDFEPENDGELGFAEGDIIEVTEKIDDNWLEGTINGKTGLFPANYVEMK